MSSARVSLRAVYSLDHDADKKQVYSRLLKKTGSKLAYLLKLVIFTSYLMKVFLFVKKSRDKKRSKSNTYSYAQSRNTIAVTLNFRRASRLEKFNEEQIALKKFSLALLRDFYGRYS